MKHPEGKEMCYEENVRSRDFYGKALGKSQQQFIHIQKESRKTLRRMEGRSAARKA